MKALYSVCLIGAGCGMVSMALARSRPAWFALGLPLIAVGLHLSGIRFSLRAFCRWAASFFAARDRDLEVVASILADIPGEFRERRFPQAQEEQHAER